jgi:hypothetical protein
VRAVNEESCAGLTRASAPGGSASRPPGFSAIMPSQAVQIKTGGTAAKAASRPGLAPESALRLHPCRALSSAPVRISVGEECCFAKLVVVADRKNNCICLPALDASEIGRPKILLDKRQGFGYRRVG